LSDTDNTISVIERHAVTTTSYPASPASAAGAHPILVDDAFRDVLASALIARHRAQIRSQPELMFMRSTWDADEWARAEADTLLAHIRAVLDRPAMRPPTPAS
jgi:hypothetical protein